MGSLLVEPARAQAGVLHVLGELSNEGHVYYPRKNLIEAAAALLEIDAGIIETAVGALAEAGQVVVTPILGSTGQEEDQAVFLASLVRAESGQPHEQLEK